MPGGGQGRGASQVKIRPQDTFKTPYDTLEAIDSLLSIRSVDISEIRLMMAAIREGYLG